VLLQSRDDECGGHDDLYPLNAFYFYLGILDAFFLLKDSLGDLRSVGRNIRSMLRAIDRIST